MLRRIGFRDTKGASNPRSPSCFLAVGYYYIAQRVVLMCSFYYTGSSRKLDQQTT